MPTKIKIEHNKKIIKGILINEDNGFLTIKLNSGYNANFKINNIVEISRENISKHLKTPQDVLKHIKTHKNTLLKITIIHTGGTIASKVDYQTGAVSSKFTPNELLNLFKELTNTAKISTKMIGNLSSEDIRFSHYNLILKEIKNSIKEGAQGIIISHGTDTIHYTSSALWYATKNLPIPIILVGAQRSSDRASSDAFGNLDAAIKFIIENNKLDKKFNRIGICMHETINDDKKFLIFDGINARKMHSSRRDAFKQINYLPFARINNDKLEILRSNLLTNISNENFSYTLFDENLKIGFFKAHPNLFPEEINNLKIYDAVVVDGTGLGHLSVSEFDKYTKINIQNLEAIKKLIKKTKIIIGVQTIYGQTNMNVYSSGRNLLETGVFGQNMNLITETLFLRTAFCLSQKEKSFKEKWKENLEGFKIRSEDLEE